MLSCQDNCLYRSQRYMEIFDYILIPYYATTASPHLITDLRLRSLGRQPSFTILFKWLEAAAGTEVT